MRVSRVLVLGFWLLAFSLPAQTNVLRSLEDLRSRLEQHVSQPKFRAGTLGVKIVSADSGAVIFEHDADELLSPASNSKLYTVALALDRLGADYRIRTSLYAKERPVQGRLLGDLIVYGRGDPNINPRVRGGLSKALQPLVAALTNAGVRQIEGDLVADESFFRGPELGSGWTWDDLDLYYGAEISSLTINDNLLGLSIRPGAAAGKPCQLAYSPSAGHIVLSNRTATVPAGSKRAIRLYRPLHGDVIYVSGEMPIDDKGYSEDVTVRSPAGFFLELFRGELERSGIEIRGQSRRVRWIDRESDPLKISSLVELGAMESLPMRDIVREVQKSSQNLYTDLLLAHVGEKRRPPHGPGANDTSEESGIRELGKLLAEIGVPRREVHFDEGSGLSRNNLATPGATVALLLHMSRHSAAKAYWDALPVAGVDGTLRNRMNGTPAAGNARAKTGTLRWASSLSGDVRTAGGDRLIFSIMLNRYCNEDPARTTREEVDFIPVTLASFAGKLERSVIPTGQRRADSPGTPIPQGK